VHLEGVLQRLDAANDSQSVRVGTARRTVEPLILVALNFSVIGPMNCFCACIFGVFTGWTTHKQKQWHVTTQQDIRARHLN